MIQLHYSGLVLEIIEETLSEHEDRKGLHMRELLLSTDSNPLFEFFDDFYTRQQFIYDSDFPPSSIHFVIHPEYHFEHLSINLDYLCITYTIANIFISFLLKYHF